MRIPFIAILGVVCIALGVKAYNGSGESYDSSASAVALVEEVKTMNTSVKEDSLSGSSEQKEATIEAPTVAASFDSEYMVVGFFNNQYSEGGREEIAAINDQNIMDREGHVQMWSNDHIVVFQGHNNKDLSDLGLLNLFAEKAVFDSQTLDINLGGIDIELKPVLYARGVADNAIFDIKDIEGVDDFIQDKEIVQGNIDNFNEGRIYVFVTCYGKRPAVKRTYVFCQI